MCILSVYIAKSGLVIIKSVLSMSVMGLKKSLDRGGWVG